MNHFPSSTESSDAPTPPFSAQSLRSRPEWEYIAHDSRPDHEHFHHESVRYGCVEVNTRTNLLHFAGRGFSTTCDMPGSYEDFIQRLDELVFFAELNQKGLPVSYNACKNSQDETGQPKDGWLRPDGSRHQGWGLN